MSEPDVDAVGDDLVLLLLACSTVLGDETLDRVRAEVGNDVRFNDGYVFQHLLAGPCTVSQLARHLGISQQAASKHVADLVARRLVTRRPSPGDGRAVEIRLSARGLRTVEAGRRARAQLGAECEQALGTGRLGELVRLLADLSGHLGAREAMTARQLRPEQGR